MFSLPTRNCTTAIEYTDHTTQCYYVQNGQALNNKVYNCNIYERKNSISTRKIMETKKAQQIYSNNLYALNNCGIELSILPKVCKFGGKIQRHRFNLHARNQQQFHWYLSETKMFQHPRRRKLHQKRLHQGHNSVVNLPELSFIRDVYCDENMKSVQTCQFMLKSFVETTMWHK